MPLDRETKSSYNIIVEVSDHGQPPQAATTVLHINVLDIDDHKPRFNRDVVSIWGIRTFMKYSYYIMSNRLL